MSRFLAMGCNPTLVRGRVQLRYAVEVVILFCVHSNINNPVKAGEGLD